MAFKLVCAFLLMVVYTHAASVVKRQIMAPGMTGQGMDMLAGMEDPLEPPELGDGGRTMPPMMGASAVRNPFGPGTLNPMSEAFLEPAELQFPPRFPPPGQRAPVRANPPAASAPAAALPALPPGFEQALLEALRIFQRQQAAAPAAAAPASSVAAAPAAAPAAPAAAPALPTGVVDAPPAGAAAQGAVSAPAAPAPAVQVPPRTGESSVMVVPGQTFSGV